MDKRDFASAVKCALETGSPLLRQYVVLKYFEGATVDEISAILRLPPSEVEKLDARVWWKVEDHIFTRIRNYQGS